MPKPLICLIALTGLVGAVGGFLTLDPSWIGPEAAENMRRAFICLLVVLLIGLVITSPNK
jgi:hypothetical protein